MTRSHAANDGLGETDQRRSLEVQIGVILAPRIKPFRGDRPVIFLVVTALPSRIEPGTTLALARWVGRTLS